MNIAKFFTPEARAKRARKRQYVALRNEMEATIALQQYVNDRRKDVAERATKAGFHGMALIVDRNGRSS
jgi:hypothetical protein